MKTYLCKEGTEEFILEAPIRKKAEEYAAMLNAVVIKEIKN